ncbi:MAG TPA: glycosyltransferase family 2 protein [Pyrinomonadaceae bacterium]|nr:glycosyltransferase family 2 protein [Pyrinomonadaceae bacterium]
MINLGLEPVGLTILTVIAWICAVGWLGFAGIALYGLAQRKPLPATSVSQLTTNPPLVSILLPARNEAHRVLSQVLASILSQDYKQIEVIAVNDRSTDSTGSILDSLAETDDRLRVINNAEPPAGWLGKPYALQRALEVSRGQWIVTLDADMVLETAAIRTALGHAIAGNSDVLTLMPSFEAGSFWERAFTPAWLLTLLGGYPFFILNHPKLKQAFAFGGFSLIRREALARIAGFSAVRADIVEDVRLAELLKNSGARYRIEHAPNLMRTRMQNGFREIWEFLSRGMLAGMRYSMVLAALTVITGYAFVVAPVFVAIVCLLMVLAGSSELPGLLFPALAIWGTQVFTLVLICRKFEIPVSYAFTTPLGLSLFYTALLISTVNIVRGKGVAWKGRQIYEMGGVGLPVRGKEARQPAVED